MKLMTIAILMIATGLVLALVEVIAWLSDRIGFLGLVIGTAVTIWIFVQILTRV